MTTTYTVPRSRLACIGLAIAVAAAALTFSLPAPRAWAATADESAIADELVSFVNRERAARGLAALAVEPHAAGVAQEWAERQRSAGALSHRPDLASRYANYPAYGENVGTTTYGSGDVHRLFMGSASHRRNIVQPGFDALGVGVACSGDGRMWVAIDFVARSQAVANRYSSNTPSSSPVAVGDAGRRCPTDAVSAATVGRPGSGGYWLVARDGGMFAFGDVAFHGSMGGHRLNQPIVGMTPTARRDGYWMVAADGGMFSFGAARFMGSMGGARLNSPIVAMTSRPQGDGYWMVAADGGMFSFGGAPFKGSMGGQPLNRPIVGMAATASGNGYWMVASDGGIFAFGDARFFGSTGGKALARPIVGMTRTLSGNGYWLIASDGGVFAFGDAAYRGSAGGVALNQPVVAGAA